MFGLRNLLIRHSRFCAGVMVVHSAGYPSCVGCVVMIVISILKRASNPQAEVGISENHGLQFLAACSRPGKARRRWGSGATGSTATHAPSPRLCCTLYCQPNFFEDAILCGIKWAKLGNLCVTSYFGVRAKMCDLFPGRATAPASNRSCGKALRQGALNVIVTGRGEAPVSRSSLIPRWLLCSPLTTAVPDHWIL